MSTLACRGCGSAIAPVGAGPAVCPNAGDGADHVVVRSLGGSGVTFPPSGAEGENPFVRYRALTHAHALALSHGMTDDDFVGVVNDLDARVKSVAGTGFVVTPFMESEALRDAVGLDRTSDLWIKDETRNVSGSHKARHLMGLAILGETSARLGLTTEGAPTRLAIASCGNAALAAAVVARAWDKPLDVFIPADANPAVVKALGELGAVAHICERVEGTPGDPCYVAFRDAVKAGGVPFCCQGPDNGLTIEGGETLGWEMLTALNARGAAIDRLFVQVGGGALASACAGAFEDAKRAGLDVSIPRLYAVQTQGAFPLRRAWERVVARIAGRLGVAAEASDEVMAEAVASAEAAPVVEEELVYAAKHRSEFMWAWEGVPTSVAHGILDDETYDWWAVVRAMIVSGGFPVVVSEEQLRDANVLARSSTNIDVDETGSAGLAGLLELLSRRPALVGENVGVIFSGVRR